MSRAAEFIKRNSTSEKVFLYWLEHFGKDLLKWRARGCASYKLDVEDKIDYHIIENNMLKTVQYKCWHMSEIEDTKYIREAIFPRLYTARKGEESELFVMKADYFVQIFWDGNEDSPDILDYHVVKAKALVERVKQGCITYPTLDELKSHYDPNVTFKRISNDEDPVYENGHLVTPYKVSVYQKKNEDETYSTFVKVPVVNKRYYKWSLEGNERNLIVYTTKWLERD